MRGLDKDEVSPLKVEAHSEVLRCRIPASLGIQSKGRSPQRSARPLNPRNERRDSPLRPLSPGHAPSPVVWLRAPGWDMFDPISRPVVRCDAPPRTSLFGRGRIPCWRP
jgi:hypothetical protein